MFDEVLGAKAALPDTAPKSTEKAPEVTVGVQKPAETPTAVAESFKASGKLILGMAWARLTKLMRGGKNPNNNRTDYSTVAGVRG
ncbi:MAG: hypothetical protein AAB592_04610 [Patescibacteria group bacterium]